jgi:predicted nucleic acid-binding protein
VRVFDASVLAVALGDDGPDGRRARALLQEAGEGAVPDCADVETAAVLRRWWLAGSLDDRRLAAALRALADLPFTRFPARPFLPRLYELRANVDAYDAVYVALAESLGCDLVTADRRLAATPGLRCPVSLVELPGT